MRLNQSSLWLGWEYTLMGSNFIAIRIVAILIASIAVFGCGKTKSIKAPSASMDATTTDDDPAVNPEDLLAGQSLLNAKFKVKVTSLLKMKVCDGDIHLKVNTGMGSNAKMFDIADGKISCPLVGRDIDLREMVGAYTGEEEAPPVVADGVLSFTKLGLGEYSPARPMFPSFLASDEKTLKSLNHNKTVNITVPDKKESGSGTIELKMLEFGVPYKAEQFGGATFKNTMRFEVLNSGFDGVTKFANMLFNRMEFVISLDPIAVLHIEFKGKIADALAADPNGGGLGGGAGGGMFGGLGGLIMGAMTKTISITMVMDLVEMEGVNPDDVQEVSPSKKKRNTTDNM